MQKNRTFFIETREGQKTDLPFLKQMLFEAFFWHSEQERPDRGEFLNQPAILKLLANWGRPGDRAIIALENEKPIGAAWYRLWTEDDHSYGFVDAHTPEIGMAVHSNFRSKGIGRRLLRALIDKARKDGFSALCLSVDPRNFARKLYETERFVKVGESGTSWTFLLQL